MSASIADKIERQSVDLMESTIPPEMTCAEWRRRQRAATGPPTPCEHLHESTSRYDRDSKQLTFLLVCPVCRTEQVIESQYYQPRFQPQPATESREATVQELPVRTSAPAASRAA